MKKKKTVRVWPKDVLKKIVPVCSVHLKGKPLKYKIIKDKSLWDGVTGYIIEIEPCQWCKALHQTQGIQHIDSIEERIRVEVKELNKLYKKWVKSKRMVINTNPDNSGEIAGCIKSATHETRMVAT